MKRNALIVLMLFFWTASAFSQYFQPTSPLKFSKSSINRSNMSQKIKTARFFATALDIEDLKVKIKRNNIEVDNQIAILKNKMSNIYMDKQELLKLVDINKMQEQIKVKQQSRADIEKQIQQDLASIAFQGLYLVVLNDIDILASKEQLAAQAEKLLAPKAIEELNGMFISSLTVIEDNRLLTDRIKATISGEMTVEKQYIAKAIDRRTKFLYLVKVSVAPLKKSLAATQNYTEQTSNHLVVNLLSDYNYQSRLQSAGISAEGIKSIAFEVNSSKAVIDGANATASRRQQLILRNGFDNLAKIDADIKEMELALANRSVRLKEIIASKTNVTFDPANIKGSIDGALAYFDRQVEQLKQQLMAAKENELVARYSVNVTAEGNPPDDIAKTAYDVYTQIKQSYSKVEQFIRETEVVNFMLESDKTGGGQDMYRDVDTIWLYPVPGDNDNFLLTVVAKFKISALQQSASPGGTPISTGKPSVQPAEQPSSLFIKGMEMVFVKGGTFMMGSNDGSDDEKPVHRVYVDDFFISKYEVTNAQFYQFLNEKGNQREGGVKWLNIKSKYCKIVTQGSKYVPVSGYDNHPVVMVSWYGARAFCQWAGGRLPTEAEWEYAARGGNKSKGYKFSGSDNVDAVAWYWNNSDASGSSNFSKGHGTMPVGKKKPNELGLYDMSGNVWEWCADRYGSDYFSKSPYENPTGPSSGADRVLRGGSWHDNAYGTRVAFRNNYDPNDGHNNFGFRCVR